MSVESWLIIRSAFINHLRSQYSSGNKALQERQGLPDIARSRILTLMALFIYSFGTRTSEQSLMTVPFSHVLRFKGIEHALQPTADS